MRRRAVPDDALDVEIVEVDHPDYLDPDVPVGVPPDDGRERAPRRVLRWVGFGVVLALAGVVVAANVVEAREEAARREVLAALPWVLPPMDEPLQEVWRAPGGWLVAESGNLIVTTSGTVDGGIRAIDAGSGQILWELAGRDSHCNGVVDYVGWDLFSPADLVPDPELLLCVEPGDGILDGANLNRVKVRDIATGTVVSTRTLEGDLLGWSAVGDDIVLVSLRPDAGVTVVRVAARSGQERWTFHGEPGVLDADAYSYSLWIDTTGTGTLRLGGDVQLALSLEAGAEVPSDAASVRGPTVDRANLPDGSTVEVRYGESGPGVTARVLDEDGSVRFEFDGYPSSPWYSDGSAPEVLLVREPDARSISGRDESGPGPRLVGLDVATGAELWTVPDEDLYVALQIDGLVAVVGSKLGVIDIRTGRWLWERPADSQMVFTLLTDGDLILVPVHDGSVTSIAAVGLRTGEESWRMRAPDGVYDVHVARDGTVLAITETEIVAYR